MGRIKTKQIKRITESLIKDNRDKFKDNFEENKVIVGSLLTNCTKKMRNVIAGYVTRLMKKPSDSDLV